MKTFFTILAILIVLMAKGQTKTAKQERILAKKYEKLFYSEAHRYYLNPTDSIYNLREKYRKLTIITLLEYQKLAYCEMVKQLKVKCTISTVQN